MRKLLLLLFLLAATLAFTACSTVGSLERAIDYGINNATNQPYFAKDKSSVAWVNQEEVKDGDKTSVRNRLCVYDSKKKAKQIVVEDLFPKADNDEQINVRIMGFYPEYKLVIYANETKNKEWGLPYERFVYYKYLDMPEVNYIGKDYLSFFQGDRGIEAVGVGSAVFVYQLSMKNAFSIDTTINYNKDVDIKSLFTDAAVTPDVKNIIYAFNYKPENQGERENKLIISGLDGLNRKELLSTKEKIELVDFTGSNKIEIREGGRVREIGF